MTVRPTLDVSVLALDEYVPVWVGSTGVLCGAVSARVAIGKSFT